MQSSEGAALAALATARSASEAFRAAAGFLAEAGDEQAQQNARLFMWYLLDVSPSDMAMRPDASIGEQGLATLAGALERRAAGEPVQYICGKAPFRFADLECRRGVFIPRPETEVLVDRALAAANALLGERDDGLLVADLCCGSGTIAVSMASECAHVRVMASDISSEAVALTSDNARALGVGDRVDAREGDLFEPMGDAMFDIVLSNPPYIPTAKIAAMPREVVDFEPMAALDGGADGLDTFRRIVAGCAGHLAPGGYLICELDEDTLDAACEVCRSAAGIGFDHVEVVRDLAGRDRIIEARRSR